jgi:hypothetical protein
MGSQRGQATIDYVAIVALLAIVFSVALASASIGAPGIVNAVSGQFRHALCLVGGGPCPDWRPKPCTVATSREQRHVAVTVLLLRYDNDKVVLREDLSDGTVRLTVSTAHGLGVEAGFGAGAGATVKGREVGASDEARVAAQLVYGSGKVYMARDGHAADAFLKAIEHGVEPSKPSQDFHEGGARSIVNAGVGGPAVGASLKGVAGMVIGYRRDLVSGERTIALDAGRNGWGALSIGLGGPAGSTDATAAFNLTLDRKHRAKELSVAVTGTLAAGASLPLVVSGALREARAGGGGSSGSLMGRRWELNARLDLRDPLVAAAWGRFRDEPTSGAAMRALGAAIRDHAAIDVRTYRTSGTSGGFSAGIAEGVRLGGEYEHTDDRSELIAASSRPSGGLWEPRLDCVSA